VSNGERATPFSVSGGCCRVRRESGEGGATGASLGRAVELLGCAVSGVAWIVVVCCEVPELSEAGGAACC
jgi:hypothetical protein